MNAHTLPPASILTDAIVKNVALLHYLAETPTVDRPLSKAEWARTVGKDAANLNRAMKLLTDDGVVEGWDEWPAARLTDLGERVLRGLRVIDGQVVLPEGVAFVRAAAITPNPDNPRTDWTSEAAVKDDAALKESIREHGVRLPLEVYPASDDGGHQLLTGERRWRAVMALIADGHLPADHEVLVIIRDLGEEDAADAMAEENIQRRQLSYTDEARYYEKMVTRFGRSEAQLAEKCNRSIKHIQNYRRLLKSPEVLEQLERGEITMRQARDAIADKRPEPALGSFMELPKSGPLAPKPPPLPDALTPEQAAYNALSTSPRMALIVCELADKTEREPESRLAADPLCDFTEIAFGPTDSLAELLIKHGVLLVMRKAGKVYARAILKSDGSRRWLEDNGFYEGEAARLGLLRQLRHEVDSFGAGKAEQTGKYLTAWLNLPEPVTEPEASAETPAPRVQPGLVGDGFSQMLRRAREEAEDGEDLDRRMVDIGKAALENATLAAPPPEPETPAAAKASPPNVSVLDAKVIAETARDLSEQLQTWRAERGRAHWSATPAEDMAKELAFALQTGRSLTAIAILAIGRHHLGVAGVNAVLSRAQDILAVEQEA